MSKKPDRRYTMRLLNREPLKPDDPIPHWLDTDQLGVWDTVEQRFVQRDPATNEWVPLP